MKASLKILSVFFIALLIGCSGKDDGKKKDGFSYKNTQNSEKEEKVTPVKTTTAAEMTDLSNKGVGPVKSVTLAPETDQKLAAEGAEVFKNMCTACHKVDKKFIGPSLIGVTERRAPEWVMNMMLNPEEMIKNDPIARQLLMESNGAPMANQNLSRDQARAILEYLRTLK